MPSLFRAIDPKGRINIRSVPGVKPGATYEAEPLPGGKIVLHPVERSKPPKPRLVRRDGKLFAIDGPPINDAIVAAALKDFP